VRNTCLKFNACSSSWPHCCTNLFLIIVFQWIYVFFCPGVVDTVWNDHFTSAALKNACALIVVLK
jgi:hypothetical protein